MIQSIIKQWEANKEKLRMYFQYTNQSDFAGEYLDIVKAVFTHVITDKEYDLDAITVVDNGHYQGTQIFLIPEKTYQPSIEQYIITNTYYGSCSGCDTLQGIREYEDGKPTYKQLEEYITLALHLIQKMVILQETKQPVDA